MNKNIVRVVLFMIWVIFTLSVANEFSSNINELEAKLDKVRTK